MIEAEALTKRYGPLTAVDELSFQVEPGEILGFLGPNGAGKSTSLRILSGYLPPTSGRARIDGCDLQDASLEARKRIGYLPENFIAPPELRVGEYLRFRGRLKGLKSAEANRRVQEVVAALGLGNRVRQPFSALSKGYRQRVGLADALLANPPALLLDEPFGGLDPVQRQDFRDFLRELAQDGKAILFSSHVLPEVEEIADRVLIIHHGKTRADSELTRLQERALNEAPVQFRTSDVEGKLLGDLKAFLHETENLSLEQSAGTYRVLPENAARRQALFRWLATQPVEVLEFRTLTPTLDDLFRSMTEEVPA
ncbi:MAG: ABC transporter ATP-binding protein [Planctomycetes bacterium]|nr:ABC transporter ATP-binding protein [Planctomycetota bacterium]